MSNLLSTLTAVSVAAAGAATPARLAAPTPAADHPCSGVLPLTPEAGQPPVGERLEYELTLGGAYMGKLELYVGDPRRVEGKEAVPLSGRLRTNAFVSAVKPVVGRYMTMVDPGTLTPLGVRVEAKVGDDERWEEVRFLEGGRKARTRFRYYGKERARHFGGEHPLLDGLSLLHLARRVPLKPGLVACQDVLSTRRMWRMRAEVLGRETVDTPVGPKPAYRVRTVFGRRGHRSPSKKIEIDVLLGDLPGRPPLAFEMTQSKLTGRASLVRWKPGRPG